MDIEVSPDQIWFHPLGTPLAECHTHLATGNAAAPPPTKDGTYDGMYVELFGTRWLASITFQDGKIQRQTLLVTTTDRKNFKHIYSEVKKEFGAGVRRGLFKPTAYIWDYQTAQLILALKEAGPLTGVYLILTAKDAGS
jgi:hypothetical protein